MNKAGRVAWTVFGIVIFLVSMAFVYIMLDAPFYGGWGECLAVQDFQSCWDEASLPPAPPMLP